MKKPNFLICVAVTTEVPQILTVAENRGMIQETIFVLVVTGKRLSHYKGNTLFNLLFSYFVPQLPDSKWPSH